MYDYFKLQFILLNRRIKSWGINPVVFYLCLTALVVLVAHLFYRQYTAVPYVLLAAQIALIGWSGGRQKNELLKTVFSSRQYQGVRVLENLIMSVPAVIIFLYNQAYVLGIVSVSLAVSGSFMVSGHSKRLTLPVPYKYYLYEFAVGFRKQFFLYPVLTVFFITGFCIGNHELSLVSYGILLFSFIGFHTQNDHEYYIWQHSGLPKAFLYQKIKAVVLYTLLTALPFILVFLLLAMEISAVAAGLMVVIILYQVLIICMKYAIFPREMTFPFMLLFMVNVFIPLLLPVCLPYFYIKSIKNLNNILV